MPVSSSVQSDSCVVLECLVLKWSGSGRCHLDCRLRAGVIPGRLMSHEGDRWKPVGTPRKEKQVRLQPGPGKTRPHPSRGRGKKSRGLQRFASMKAASCDFETAPTLVASTAPFLNSMSVGMPRMPYFGG